MEDPVAQATVTSRSPFALGCLVAPDVGSAISSSNLRSLPDPSLRELLAGSSTVPIPTGSLTHREGETARHLDLVVSGLLRGYVTVPDGRSLTIRYCRAGALTGAASLFAEHFTMPATTQALMPTVVLRLSPSTARRVAARDPRVAQAMLAELSERVLSFAREIPGSALTSVRQRVARHLLDLASEMISPGAGRHDARHELVAPVSQRQLAEAAGTAREVVVRTLRDLRGDGIVRTGRDFIVIVDPDRLAEEIGWNTGS